MKKPVKKSSKMGRISRGVAISERGYVCFAAVALVDSSISQSCHGGASLHVQLLPLPGQQNIPGCQKPLISSRNSMISCSRPILDLKRRRHTWRWMWSLWLGSKKHYVLCGKRGGKWLQTAEYAASAGSGSVTQL